MAVTHPEMRWLSARLRTFEQPQPIRTRQVTGQAKKNTSTTKWPHERPDPLLLARAGFFYRPDEESFDNVTCFLCDVRLDGWEETDVPLQEHLAHTNSCPWATSLSVEDADQELRDPLSAEMLESRRATFEPTTLETVGWPHEFKKGWKCKIAKMVEAGWCWDPSVEAFPGLQGGDGFDGVTCFYCGLSLDGWEPKDDPFTEHKRREPGCRYFELLERFHGADAANGKIKKSMYGRKGARASTASKAGRISAMSAMSAISDVPNIPGSNIDSLANVDDSNVTTASNASSATASGTTQSRKKPNKTKAPAKGTKGRKKATDESVVDDNVPYPNLAQAEHAEQIPPEPAKKGKRGTRASKQVDSSVIEISQSEMVAPKKVSRSKKGQTEPEPETEVPPTAEAWAEMNHEFQADEFAPGEESTPAAERANSKRGVKRSSDGSRKHQVAESSVIEVDAAPVPAAKRKRGHPKKASTMSADSKADATMDDGPSNMEQDSTEMSVAPQAEAPAKKARGRPKGKKNSRARSSSQARSTTTDQSHVADEPEDLARDEMEIEQELARIAAEQASQQAVQDEQEQVEEFEASPSSGRVSKDSAELQKLQDEVEADDNSVPQIDSPPRRSHDPNGVNPSPSGSDKENMQSSIIEPSAEEAQPPVVLSPTKTVKVPLAASTPDRSPAKTMLSPSKQISHLRSAAPWTPVDPVTTLLSALETDDEQEDLDEPGGQLSELLHAAAGDLQSPEKRMTVEQWILHRAEKGEADLKKRCELMVSTLERHGIRALESVRGIYVVAL